MLSKGMELTVSILFWLRIFYSLSGIFYFNFYTFKKINLLTNTNGMAGKIGHGEAIQCIREIKGIKQEALAEIMGDDWTQKKISLLEKKEIIEPEIMEQVAKALGVSIEAI